MAAALLEGATFAPVEADEGDQIRQRREALGMGIAQLADRAGVDRGRLSKIEKGAEARGTTLSAIKRALDQLEEETSGPYDEQHEEHTVTFRMSGNFGVDVTVEGPVENLAELEASVGRLLQRMRNNHESD